MTDAYAAMPRAAAALASLASLVSSASLRGLSSVIRSRPLEALDRESFTIYGTYVELVPKRNVTDLIPP